MFRSILAQFIGIWQVLAIGAGSPVPMGWPGGRRRVRLVTQLARKHDGIVVFPPMLTIGIVGICLMPFLLNQLGLDFASLQVDVSPQDLLEASTDQIQDVMHTALAGSYIHTILEWSAFCAAIFTTVLAFAYFSNQQDVTTPVIGVGLLCAGLMDAFHTLAADRLIDAVADNQDLIPFTWALCRMFNAMISIVGTAIFIVGRRQERVRNSSLYLVGISIVFVLIAYGTIYLCATQQTLPKTTFPDSFITRPWDVWPLLLYLFAGLWLYPKFYSMYPSLFSYALIISVVPNVVTQLHMAFGSTALFDNHFNIAHFLKVVAYLVPLIGLVLDYIYTHRQLSTRNSDLQQTLTDLQETQIQLIQSEKMSGLGQMVSGIAHEINNPVNFIHGNLKHMEIYIGDLLELTHQYQNIYPEPPSALQEQLDRVDLPFVEKDAPKLVESMRMGTVRIREIVKSLRTFSRLDEADCKEVDIHDGIESTLLIIQHRFQAQADGPAVQLVRQYGDLPQVQCYAGQLNQVFMNVIVNALDAMEQVDCATHAAPKILTITTEYLQEEQRAKIMIGDTGKGIPNDILPKIFEPFFTTKPVGKGTGLGMSISHQIVTESHRGTFTCSSTVGQGTEFSITIPVRQSQFSN